MRVNGDERLRGDLAYRQGVEVTAAGGWLVLLVGGHSGAGKSTLAAEVARRTGAAWTEVDDVRLALQRVTTPEQVPGVHYFTSEPGVEREGIWERDPDELVKGLVGVAEVMTRGLGVVVGYHVLARRPLVLEGDGILPGLAMGEGEGWGPHVEQHRERVGAGAVRSLFLVEPEWGVVRSRMGSAGPAGDTQATMHWRYGQWLRGEAERLGQPVVAPRPYDTLVERVLEVVGPPGARGHL